MQTRDPGSVVAWEQCIGDISISYVEKIDFIDNNMILPCLKGWKVAISLSGLHYYYYFYYYYYFNG